jgi:sugar lactone lactonase YvrE
MDTQRQDQVIGSGEWRYSFRRDWAKLPRWWSFDTTAVGARPAGGVYSVPGTAVSGAVTANGDVYVLNRGAHPVIVFDAEGNFVTSWGEGRFSNFVHGMTVAPDGRIWIADSGLHTVTRHDPDGTLLQTLGAHGVAMPTFYAKPFNLPTGTAFTSRGDIVVSDGYGNRRVHRFSPNGELQHSFGEHGTGPGQFVLVHFVAIDREDRIYICDRDNHRIQLFDLAGSMLADWREFTMPSDLAFGRDHIYVASQDALTIWTPDRRAVARFPRDEPFANAFNVHGIWLDAEENIYLAQFDRAVSKLTRLR